MIMKPIINNILIFLIFSATFVYGSERTIAVLDFDNNSLFNSAEYEPLTKGFAEIFITELSKVQSIKIVERQRLKTLLDELKLSQSGMLTQDHSLKIGKMLGARHLVFGGFIVTPEKKIRIDVRVVEVETGLTIIASEVTGKTKQVLSLIRKLSRQILEDLDVRLTSQEKKFFKNTGNVPIGAIMQFSKGLDYEDRKQWDRAKSCYLKALQIEPEFQRARNRLLRLSKDKSEITE
jgi:TolB-like protein